MPSSVYGEQKLLYLKNRYLLLGCVTICVIKVAYVLPWKVMKELEKISSRILGYGKLRMASI